MYIYAGIDTVGSCSSIHHLLRKPFQCWHLHSLRVSRAQPHGTVNPQQQWIGVRLSGSAVVESTDALSTDKAMPNVGLQGQRDFGSRDIEV